MENARGELTPAELLAFLHQARGSGQWEAADQLYPHEHAQLACYVLQALGYPVELERQIVSVESPTLRAKGVESGMVYAYRITFPGSEHPPMGLSGQQEEGEILREAAEREYPGGQVTRPGGWSAFECPSLARYQADGRSYRLTPQAAAGQVARGVAALEGVILNHATGEARPGSRRRI